MKWVTTLANSDKTMLYTVTKMVSIVSQIVRVNCLVVAFVLLTWKWGFNLSDAFWPKSRCCSSLVPLAAEGEEEREQSLGGLQTLLLFSSLPKLLSALAPKSRQNPPFPVGLESGSVRIGLLEHVGVCFCPTKTGSARLSSPIETFHGDRRCIS